MPDDKASPYVTTVPTVPGWLRKAAAAAFLGFWALVFFRMLVGLWIDQPPTVEQQVGSFRGSFDFFSSGYRKDYSNNTASFELTLDQPIPIGQLGELEVYTREARLGATTGRFDEALEAALGVIDAHNAQIRLEANEGIAPNRSFSVVVRAPVERFDDCLAALRGVGVEQTYSVTKEDKSEEARKRFAERDALRSHAESLGKLREAGGDVSDLIQLESKIRDVEQKIQALNVSLGEFVKEASYNNINYSLREDVLLDIDEKAFPISARFARAVAWSLKWMFLAISLAALVALTRLSIRQLAAG